MNKHRKTNNWPSKKELESNRKLLEQELKRELNQYEQRYELKSENLELAFKAGKIKDTAEICNWAISYDIYKRVTNGK